MTGTRSSQEYASGVFHSPVPRPTWLESKVPQEGKDGRVCARRVTPTHAEGMRYVFSLPTIHPISRREPKNATLNLGESLTVSAPRVTETCTRAIYPQFLNHLEDPVHQYKCRRTSGEKLEIWSERHAQVCVLHLRTGTPPKSPPQPTWKLLQSERKDLKMKLQLGVPDLPSSPTLQITVSKGQTLWHYSISTATKTCELPRQQKRVR